MPTVAVIGAGTMGSGIAQVAAASGWTVLLRDTNTELVEKSIAGVRKRYARLVEKGRLTDEQAASAGERLRVANAPADCGDASLVVEAVLEDLDLKANVFTDLLPHLRDDCVLATNTSSLSVSDLAAKLPDPGRLVGMHFFNPVPLMPLVEVIAGRQSAPAHVDFVAQIAREWGKTPARASDTPGFIVNRVARGYYLEPMRMLAEGVAGIDEIDGILRRLVGFRMGPFELTDAIGHDVNYTVSRQVWEQLGKPARLTPSPLQQALFDAGKFGRKTKLGWYSYQGEHPLPAVPVDRRSFDLPEGVHQAVRLFTEKLIPGGGSITEHYIVARTLVTIINEAALAMDDNVATEADINTALKLGTNYPQGPFEWADTAGRRTCRFLLDTLNRSVDDGRFQAAGSLRSQ